MEIKLTPENRTHWSNLLEQYAGKVLFDRYHAYVSTNSEYVQKQYKWGEIWDIMLYSLFKEFPHEKQNTKEYYERLNELDQHMFNILRLIYQAPLLHYTQIYTIGKKECETNTKDECFILKSSNNHFYTGKYIPHLYLVVRSEHNIDASYIYDLTDTKNDNNCMTYGNYKIYIE